MWSKHRTHSEPFACSMDCGIALVELQRLFMTGAFEQVLVRCAQCTRAFFASSSPPRPPSPPTTTTTSPTHPTPPHPTLSNPLPLLPLPPLTPPPSAHAQPRALHARFSRPCRSRSSQHLQTRPPPMQMRSRLQRRRANSVWSMPKGESSTQTCHQGESSGDAVAMLHET